MKEVNYILHLNAVFDQFSKDSRLNPSHISLYVALFQLWNSNHFPEEFFVNREEVMQLAKVGSKSTYHRCIKELSHWKYIVYYPSHNPYKGSRFKLFKFGTSTGQVVVHNRTKIETSTGQALVPIYKHIETIKNNKTLKKEKVENPENAPPHGGVREAGGGLKQNPTVPKMDNLKTTKNKNYNEPL
ncbi:hypothetical protein ACFO5O_15005 [Geojedonia litorea]|uniref:Transcriptional regulator n=1 Tax=Geojedonia litorea TaxID=1268269 RepID=A0ABV9NAL7_9FLAO